MIRALRGGLLACLLGACAHPSVAPRGPEPAPGAAAMSRARTALDAGDSVRSEQYALLALRQGHSEHEVIMPLVRACLASSRLRAALLYAEPYLRKHPQHVGLRYLVAAIELALGHPERARRELQRVSARRPELPEPYYLDGVIARDAFGDAPAARAQFQRYLAREPDGAHAAEVSAWLSEAP